MTFVSSFLIGELIKVLEQEFVKAEPFLKDEILKEVGVALELLQSWLNGKLSQGQK